MCILKKTPWNLQNRLGLAFFYKNLGFHWKPWETVISVQHGFWKTAVFNFKTEPALIKSTTNKAKGYLEQKDFQTSTVICVPWMRCPSSAAIAALASSSDSIC